MSANLSKLFFLNKMSNLLYKFFLMPIIIPSTFLLNRKPLRAQKFYLFSFLQNIFHLSYISFVNVCRTDFPPDPLPCFYCNLICPSPGLENIFFGWTHSFLKQKWLRKRVKLNAKFSRHFDIKSTFHIK